MRILSVTHMFPNRVLPNYGIFVKERLKAVSQLVETIIIAPLPYSPFITFITKYKNLNYLPFIENFDSLNVYHPKYIVFPKFFKFTDGYLYYWSTYSFFSKKIANEHIDLLDFHWIYPDAFAGLRLAKKYNKKIIVTIRGNESICYFEKSLRKKMLINTLKSVDHIIAVSSDMKNKIVEKYDIDAAKVTVISNGIDNKKFYSINKYEARKSCGLEMHKKYILSLSRLSHEKGLEYLFEAFASLEAKNTELIVVGDGPLKKKLHQIALNLEIANNVKFIGTVAHDETIWWYNAADVYCLPSLWEGCPNVIIESLACGTPVVSTKVGGIPDLVTDNAYGFLVPAGDADSLANALNNALKKKWDRVYIANYGAQNTWNQVADKVIDVFKSVLEEGR